MASRARPHTSCLPGINCLVNSDSAWWCHWVAKIAGVPVLRKLVLYSHIVLMPDSTSLRCNVPALCCDTGPSCVVCPPLDMPHLSRRKTCEKTWGICARHPQPKSGDFLFPFGHKRSRVTTQLKRSVTNAGKTDDSFFPRRSTGLGCMYPSTLPTLHAFVPYSEQTSSSFKRGSFAFRNDVVPVVHKET